MVNMRELFRYSRLGDVDMDRVSITAANEDRHLLRKGDLLFARRSLTLEGAGKCSLVIEIGEPTTWESSIIRARIDRTIADSHYYYYYFTSPVGRGSIETIVEQVAAAGIRSSDLARIPVPFPDRREQTAVSTALGALDDKIAANERIVLASHQLAQAYVVSAVDSTSCAALSELADITMGSSPPGDTYNEERVGLPFYQGTRDFGFRFPSRRVWCTDPMRTAQPGATLVSVRAPVGRLNFATEVCCIGRGLAGLVSKHDTPSLLFHTLVAVADAWAPFESEGTVFGSIDKKQLAGLAVPRLDSMTARGLESVLARLDNRVGLAFLESEALAELRDALLPGLMSGEIRVREAEKAVEQAT